MESAVRCSDPAAVDPVSAEQPVIPKIKRLQNPIANTQFYFALA